MLVVTVLGVGLGANAALFSIIDRVLLHPFNFRDPDRLAAISGLDAKGRPRGITPAVFEYCRGRVAALEESAIWRWQDFTLTGVDDPEKVIALQVSARAFPLLGVAPIGGRVLQASDFEKDSAPAVVISYRLWHRDFGGDAAVIGRKILLDGKAYTVAGIMGPQFAFDRAGIDAWMPLDPVRTAKEELSHGYNAMARLRPGATIEQAQQELNALAPMLPKSPGEPAGSHAVLRPLADQYVGEYRRALYVLWGAVLLVISIACANAANLMLARASQRQVEFVVRASLGAGRMALARQVLVESTLLGSAAAVAGIGIAELLFRVLLLRFADEIAFINADKLALTPAAVSVTVVAALAATFIAALPSCWRVWRANVPAPSSRTASTDRGSNRTRSAVVAFEVALSMMLLTGAGVMLHSLYRLLQVPLGFRPDHVLTARVSAPPQLKDKDQIAGYYRDVLQQAESIPGVRCGAAVTILPMGNLVATTSLTVEGRPDNPADPEWHNYGVRLRSVTPRYFETMRVRLLRGRTFSDGDTSKSPGVAIINEDFARHFWPGQDPIGKRISRSDHPRPDEWLTVVGVIESAQDGEPRRRPGAELYRPFAQDTLGARFASVVVRTQGDPLTIASALRKRIHAINPDQPVTEVQTMERWVEHATAQPRFNAFLLDLFAAIALLLAISGVFAVVSYMVAARTREIGIRSALGASARDIAGYVVGLGLRPVCAGTVVGCAAAAATTRLLKSQLFETSPLDPGVFGVVVGLLLVATVAAALIPARRAVRIDPAAALRSE